MKGEGSISSNIQISSAGVFIAAPFLVFPFLLPALTSAGIISSQPNHSIDTRSIGIGPTCVPLIATSTRNLGNLTLFFGTNTFSNIYEPGPHWIVTVGIFSSVDCTSGNQGNVMYKDSYIPTADNSPYTFDASFGFWNRAGYGGYGSQATTASTPSFAGARSFLFAVSRATTPTFSSNGMSPCGGYCGGYLQGDGTTPAYILEDDGLTATTTPVCTENCNSNVLFLPGIEASRLYRPQVVGDPDKRLWEPGIHDDLRDLYMTANGTSVRDDVYTKVGDVLDETPVGANIYQSFIARMNSLETAGTIADWESAPYDWRLSLDDILVSGTQTGDRISYLATTSTPYIEQELRRLAASSRTGKVTIVAHSNGGLVAKALMHKLGATTTTQLIDTVIFVASPQAGTPAALAALMHGHDQAIAGGIVVNKADARTFASTSPMTYHLMPSARYFTYVDDPVVSFDNTLTDWIARYGDVIHSEERLHAFVADAYGRVDAKTGDIDQPIQGSDVLLSDAEAVHDDLDGWAAPAGVRVIQIAGWGVPSTVTGIHYKKRDMGVTPDPQFTIDGDGTVVVPSALWTSAAGAENYWMNLNDYNRDHPIQSGFGLSFLVFEHSRILEASAVLDFISDSIASSTQSLSRYQYLSTQPPFSTDTRLRYALHSPLTLDLYDDQGRHTGVSTTTGQVEEQIPGTYYLEFGEAKYLFTDASTTAHIVMDGYDSGTFTFNVDEYQGDTLTASTTFKDIPTTPSTTVSLDIQSDISTLSPMQIDKNGDGATDATITPVPDGVATLDTTPPEIMVTFATSTNSIAFIGVDDVSATTITATTTYPSLKKYQKDPKGIAATTVTVRDESGNTTVLVYTERLPSPKQRDTITLQSISYNPSITSGQAAATTTIASTTLSYKWRTNKDGLYKLFASRLQTIATTTESHYRPKRDETVIMTKPRDLDDTDDDDDVDSRPIKQRLPGMIIPYMRTEEGRVIIGY